MLGRFMAGSAGNALAPRASVGDLDRAARLRIRLGDRLAAAAQRARTPRTCPLFVAFAAADRLAFFLVWTLLQALALRRFVTHVPIRSVVAVRGGSELLRTISNPLSDAAFFVGLGELAGQRFDAVLASALVPVICHFVVMLFMMTLALPTCPGGIGANRDVAMTAGVLWAILITLGVGVRLSHAAAGALSGRGGDPHWVERFPLSKLRPFLLGFVALVLFDVTIQKLASAAFGISIPWLALAARIPVLYLALSIPTLGNFGTRELTWAATLRRLRRSRHADRLRTRHQRGVPDDEPGPRADLPAARAPAARHRAASRAAPAKPIPEPLLHDPTDL